MKAEELTEIEKCRESIKEYRKGYGQHQLKDDCIIQLMIGHHQSRVNAISDDDIKILFRNSYNQDGYTERNNPHLYLIFNEAIRIFKEKLLKK